MYQYLLPYTHYPNTEQLKTTNIHDLTLSAGQDSGYGFTEYLWIKVSPEAAVLLLVLAVVSSKGRGGPASHLTHMAVDRLQFLT